MSIGVPAMLLHASRRLGDLCAAVKCAISITTNTSKSSIDWEIDRGSHAHLEGSNLSIDEHYIAYIDLPGGCLG